MIAKLVVVAPVAVMFWKALVPEKVLSFASKVEDAAVIVIESPLLKVVLLMVPSSPEILSAPIEVVATTVPFAFVERSAFASDVMAKFVVVALVVVAKVKTAVLGVEAPIGVLSMVPPEMVRSLATKESAMAVPSHTPVPMVPSEVRFERVSIAASIVLSVVASIASMLFRDAVSPPENIEVPPKVISPP